MHIICLIIALILGVCIVPRKKIFMYMYLSVAILAFLMLFMWTDNAYDLYRHYLMLDKYRTLRLSQVLNISERFVGTGTIETAVDVYINSYPVYSIYAWLISKTGIYQLLPFLTVGIVYGLAIYRIKAVAVKNQSYGRAIAVTYIFVLICYNYVFVASNIRQPLASAIFAFALYEDLVNKKNRVGCIILYIFACLIHSSAYMFLGLRLAVAFYNKYTRVFIFGALLAANSIIPIICKQLVKWNIGILLVAADKYLRYTVVRTNAGGTHVSYKLLAMYFMILIILSLFIYGSMHYKQYKKYCTLIALSIVFALTMTNQSDIFNRFEFFLFPLIIPIIQELLCEYSGHRIFSVKAIGKKYKYYLLVILSFVFIAITNWSIACIKNYSVTTPYYSICNFLHNGSLDLPAERDSVQ